MVKLVTEGSETAQWYTLVSEAGAMLGVQLHEDVESYLVFLLMRFRSRPDMASRVLALDYLRGLQAAGNQRHERLREVGDHCLLYSGFFPRRARRLNVGRDYFVNMGRGAYRALGDLSAGTVADMFTLLGRQFTVLVHMLGTMRGLSPQIATPPLLEDPARDRRRFH